MDTKKYWTNLYAIYDTTSEEIVTTGRANNAGQYARDMIPNMKGLRPLNDLLILQLGEICIGTGEIKPNQIIKKIDWKEAYNFEVTNKAVKDQSETTSDKETDKE